MKSSHAEQNTDAEFLGYTAKVTIDRSGVPDTKTLRELRRAGVVSPRVLSDGTYVYTRGDILKLRAHRKARGLRVPPLGI